LFNLLSTKLFVGLCSENGKPKLKRLYHCNQEAFKKLFYLLKTYWVRVNEDGTQKKYENVRSELKKSTSRMIICLRQLKGLKLSQIILKYVNILPAKFDLEKSEAEQS